MPQSKNRYWDEKKLKKDSRSGFIYTTVLQFIEIYGTLGCCLFEQQL